VCRHTRIDESVERIAAVLQACIPLESMLIRRVDLPRGTLDLVAESSRKSESEFPARLECKSDEMMELLAWCRKGEALRLGPKQTHLAVRAAIPARTHGDLIVGPLIGTPEPAGVALFLGQRGKTFEAKHEALISQLLEPLSIALENDARLREMATLREAAEADKRSLLTRLGRQDISDTIVGGERGLRHVMERVDLVARSDAPVLLFGETGSGKEVIARAIHNRSPRAAAPFHRVNCGAIPTDLIDSELFGHEKGSFTGAVGMRKGWFERADDGTLFLDEIGELPPAAQVRLLRILQDGAFERVGGQTQLHVNVRIVAATHRNLQAMVAEGRFREDLWYRIAIFPVFLPALRDRPEDIPEMAAHFALKAARRFGVTPMSPTPDDMHLLLTYSWPGNVRELGAVMDRAVILGNGHRLEVGKALGAADRPAVSSPARVVNSRVDLAGLPEGDIATLDAAMKRHIELALAKTRGRVEGPHGTAALLGINPHTLRARMRKLKIDWARFR
jgi:transcriptional regulator with GAF, ATPase, and Fis domain